MYKVYFSIIFLISLLALFRADTLAFFSGVANHVVVDDLNLYPNGSVVSFVDNKYILATASSQTVAGFVNYNPKIEINDFPNQITVPLVKSGFGYARVSTSNGAILSGDFLTLSTIPGVLIKAGQASEFILGQSLESFDSEGEKLISIDIFIQKKSPLYARTGLKFTDAVRESFFDMFAVMRTASQVPASQAFRYVLSGLILFIALVLSLLTFVRSSQKGIEAIGRNPLAKNMIIMGVGINVFFSIVIVFCAVLAAYFVIKL